MSTGSAGPCRERVVKDERKMPLFSKPYSGWGSRMTPLKNGAFESIMKPINWLYWYFWEIECFSFVLLFQIIDFNRIYNYISTYLVKV